MRKKGKRVLKSAVSIVLAVVLLASDIPDLGLTLRVMANPKPDQVTVNQKGETSGTGGSEEQHPHGAAEEKKKEGHKEPDRKPAPQKGKVAGAEQPKKADGPKKAEEPKKAEQAKPAGQSPTDIWEEPAFVAPEYEKTALPEDTVYDEVVTGDTVITEDIRNKKIWYQGDVTIGGNVSLRECTVKISGDLNLQSGSLNVDSAVTLWVEGNFYIQAKNEAGERTATKAYLGGIGKQSAVVVKGDFYTESLDSANQINQGNTLELYGNFHHLGESYFNIWPGLTGKTVFAGEAQQHISMGEGTNAKLDRILVANKEGKLRADTTLWGVELMHDTVIGGTDVSLSGHTNGHHLKIEGSYLETDLSLEEGSVLLVEGDYRIQSRQPDGSYGETDRYLSLTDAAVVVKGNFYTQSSSGLNAVSDKSVLRLHGDFHQIGGSFFNQHSLPGRIVFVGDRPQHVSMGEAENATLNPIEIANSEGKIHADTPLWGVELTQDTVIDGEDVILTGNANGYKLTIPKNYLGTEMKLNQSSVLDIGGDYRIQEKLPDGNYGETDRYLLAEKDSKIIVRGDFYTQSTDRSNQVNTGSILELHGNFHQIGSSSFNYACIPGKTVFAGETPQHISMGAEENAKLSAIEITNAQGRIHADTPIWGLELMHNTVIEGEDVLLTGDTKGHSLTIEGTYLGTGMKLSQGSTLLVKGDYRIQDKKKDGSYGETPRCLSAQPNSKTVVEGDFYTQSSDPLNQVSPESTLELHGNFYQIGDTCLNQYEARGRIVFAGDGT